MDAYLREHADLLQALFQKSVAVYERYFGQTFLDSFKKFHDWERRNPEALLSVDVSGESATAITRTSSLALPEGRSRYLLTVSGETWRISRMDSMCYVCEGSGQVAGCVCGVCSGEGWMKGK